MTREVPDIDPWLLRAAAPFTDEQLATELARGGDEAERLAQGRGLTDAQFERVIAALGPSYRDASLRRLRALRGQLGEVDDVEALLLCDGDELETGGNWRWGIEARCTLDVMASRQVAALLDALPYAIAARCHTAVYGLRLRAAGKELAAMSICFKCHNVMIKTVDGDSGMSIDGGSAVARALIGVLRGLLHAEE